MDAAMWAWLPVCACASARARANSYNSIVVMHQETHHSGGIPLCILIIPECFAQNLEGIASADLSPLFAATVLISSKQHNIF